MHILLIEDDPEVAHYILRGLKEHGHSCDITANGIDGLERAGSSKYDALIIDRMLPGMEGLNIIKELRKQNNHTPALVLSALGGIDDRVEGLKAGGDDYLIKPFALIELLARLEALARRNQPANHSEIILTVGDLSMDVITRKVTRGSDSIPLQAREFKLLEFLLRHKNQVVTRTMLLEHVWEYHFDPQTNVIDVHISRLRQKIDPSSEQSFIKTIRGAGYTIEDSSSTT